MKSVAHALILFGACANTQAQPENSFLVEGFTNAAAVSSFEIEGISLETPLARIPEILESRGYEEIFSDKPGYLEYIKGGRRPTELGKSSFRVKVQQDGAGRTIELSRMVRGEKPLANHVHAQEAGRLKKLICEGVPDETQRWRLCPPNTDTKITFGAGRQAVKLTSGLMVHALRVSTTGSAIRVERR